jgi:hypothetical protein
MFHHRLLLLNDAEKIIGRLERSAIRAESRESLL